MLITLVDTILNLLISVVPIFELKSKFHEELEYILTSYSIVSSDIINFKKVVDIGSLELFIPPDQLDTRYNYDFTNINDNKRTFMRGNFNYNRPYGWKRFAIKVLDKYEDNTWFGAEGRKNEQHSTQNEWPVCYHGTVIYNCRSIVENGYLLSKGKRFRFGVGIYSTPDINVAAEYSLKFAHKGSYYIVVIQNRVNPKSLIKISKMKTNIGEYWIAPTGDDIRPYGICIKKVL
ncbi:hypothetical protein RhiirA1_538276 [Rhizophagus irregularis]|uniref:PARP catalytic domain-containing protein n=1 Tax=Rhizophagus irregularis TaxID=588596 RepID=A0A2N0RHD1_9GLOM|nr:hypothetical protein RhiirA1_538276 [Rhizophagus irregularis]